MTDSSRCRTCLAASDNLKSMFIAWDDSINFWDMYKYIMNVGENLDVESSSGICIKCEENLKSAYIFKLMCVETEKKLSSKLETMEKSVLQKSDNESETDCPNFEDNYSTDLLESDIAEISTEVYHICEDNQDDWHKSLDNNINQMKATDKTIENSTIQLTDTKERGRKCKLCDVHFENIKSYQVHYRQVHYHPVSKVLCSHCGKLVAKHSIDKHLNSHSNIKVKNNLCTICGKRFTLTENLKKHLRIHSNDKRYTCDICGEKFIHWNSKRSHIRAKHTGEKKYQCNICDKKFAQSSNLFRHIRQHTNDLRHSCSNCSKRFQTKTELNNHLVVHTKEKNEICVECFKCFGTRKALRSHLKVHSGERNYVCSICTKGFTQPHVLRTHLKTHPGCEIPPRGVILSQKALGRISQHILNEQTVTDKL